LLDRAGAAALSLDPGDHREGASKGGTDET
jgi:hypothetical protein